MTLPHTWRPLGVSLGSRGTARYHRPCERCVIGTWLVYFTVSVLLLGITPPLFILCKRLPSSVKLSYARTPLRVYNCQHIREFTYTPESNTRDFSGSA